MKTFVEEILLDVRAELDATKAKRPLTEIRRMAWMRQPFDRWPRLWRTSSA